VKSIGEPKPRSMYGEPELGIEDPFRYGRDCEGGAVVIDVDSSRS